MKSEFLNHEKTILKYKKTEEHRSGLQVMAGLLGMVRPFTPIMSVAILMGTLGNLFAISLTILGGMAIAYVLDLDKTVSMQMIVTCLFLFAIFRGILRYAEQACNHYIAFKVLAYIRAKVFAALRRLTPAKLDGNDKGNLISLITSDVELLEVFFAHTISPIVIASLTSICMVLWMGHFHVAVGVYAMICYGIVGVLIPIINSKFGAEKGKRYRDSFGNLNSTVLDNLFGLQEILQFGQVKEQIQRMQQQTRNLDDIGWKLKRAENVQRNSTEGFILVAGVGMCIVTAYFTQVGEMNFAQSFQAVIAIMSSFGPVVALSSLSNQLHQTLASGERVLHLLEEEPVAEEVVAGRKATEGDITCENVSFSYEKNAQEVLHDFSHDFSKGKIHGILGRSGCGKSTLLKLMMRFYLVGNGRISSDSIDINNITSESLRKHIAYMTQETFLFQDTIEQNIKIGNIDATREEVMEAAKKASIHDFISSLPEGYDTKISELGDSVSGGEKQRIGLARVFLYDSKVIFLDEPTSNIDSMNEGIILRSLQQEKEDRTIILVSHRKSTMGIVEEQIAM